MRLLTGRECDEEFDIRSRFNEARVDAEARTLQRKKLLSRRSQSRRLEGETTKGGCRMEKQGKSGIHRKGKLPLVRYWTDHGYLSL